jgi:hypothetical protein
MKIPRQRRDGETASAAGQVDGQRSCSRAPSAPSRGLTACSADPLRCASSELSVQRRLRHPGCCAETSRSRTDLRCGRRCGAPRPPLLTRKNFQRSVVSASGCKAPPLARCPGRRERGAPEPARRARSPGDTPGAVTREALTGSGSRRPSRPACRPGALARDPHRQGRVGLPSQVRHAPPRRAGRDPLRSPAITTTVFPQSGRASGVAAAQAGRLSEARRRRVDRDALSSPWARAAAAPRGTSGGDRIFQLGYSRTSPHRPGRCVGPMPVEVVNPGRNGRGGSSHAGAARMGLGVALLRLGLVEVLEAGLDPACASGGADERAVSSRPRPRPPRSCARAPAAAAALRVHQHAVPRAGSR